MTKQYLKIHVKSLNKIVLWNKEVGEGGESKRAQVSTKRLNVDSLSWEKNRQKIFVLCFYLVFYSQNLKRRKVIFLKYNDIVMWNGAGVPHIHFHSLKYTYLGQCCIV